MATTPLRVGLDLSCIIPQPLTGVGYHALRLTEAMLTHTPDLELRVFAGSAQPCPECLTRLAPRVASFRAVRWPTRLRTWLWTNVEWPPMEWFTGPVDVAHGLFHQLPAARRACRIATVHDLTGFRQPETHTSAAVQEHLVLLKHAASRAAALVADSESTRRDAIELLGMPETNVHVVYSGIDMEEFAKPFDAEAHRGVMKCYGIEGAYFLHLGTLQPRKNIPRLLEAYSRLQARYSDCPKVVLAGAMGWKSEAIVETVERLGLGAQVIQTGYLEREAAVLLLRGAYACVYPSLYEGFGIPVLEAMAARVPVLTSNVSSLPEVIGDTGLLVEPESVESIEAALSELMDHREASLARTEAAFARAHLFTWDVIARSMAAVYRRVVEEAR